MTEPEPEAAETAAANVFRTRRRIEFADTDMGGIVHFSRFFVFMETAEHEFLRSLGARVHMEWEGNQIGWPRVQASCVYSRPVRYGDEIDIEMGIERRGKSSMTYSFSFSRGDSEIAHGRITSVCCVLDDPAGVRAIPIPPFLVERIRGATR